MASSRNQRDSYNGENSAELEDMMSSLTINPEPGILKVEETFQRFYRSLKKCTECEEETLEDIPLDGGDVHIKRCLSCNHHFGLDDQSSVYDVHKTVMSWKAQICQCGNTDLEGYIVTTDGDGLGVRCQKCQAKIPLAMLHPSCSSTEGRNGSNMSSSSRSEKDKVKLKCKCGNETEELFGVFFYPEQKDKILGIKCHQCQLEWANESEDDFSEECVIPNLDGDSITRPAGRTQISNAWRLHEGDHLAWWRSEGYWHHALVESVYPQSNTVNVLHYNGPSPMGHKVKGKIVEEKLNLSCEKGLLYRINYDGECYPAAIAVARGRMRLGEIDYSLITNNCEHFVRWCKTGFDKSQQVESLAKTLIRIGGNLTSCLSSKGLGKIFTKIAGFALTGAAAEARQVLGEGAALVTGQQICEALGVGAIVAIEAAFMGRDIYRAHQLRKQGKYSRDEFVNVVFRRAAQGVAGAAGSAIGMYLGQVLIPVPVVGALVGCTLGALIGHGLGHYGGYLCASLRRKEDKDQYISAASLEEYGH